MRKIVASLFVSLDGVMEAPETWGDGYFSEAVRQVPWSVIDSADALLLGRVTYQTFAQAFTGEKADDPFAALIGGKPKFVVSATLETADWRNSTLVNGDIAEDEITKLKEQPGGTIGISGSPTLVGGLLRQGLLDELDLCVFPVVVGSGRRLFEGAGDLVAVKLAATEALDNGVLHHTYTRG
jgi:dihydrofolate reductase